MKNSALKYVKVGVPMLLTTVLLLSTLLCSAFAQSGMPFKDVNTKLEADLWWTSQLEQAYQLKILNGTGPDKYSPNLTVSYAEFITSLVRLKENYNWKAQNDVAWYHGYINKAAQLGMLKDVSESDYTRPIPRQEMMKILCNAFGLKPQYSSKFFIDDKNIKVEDVGCIITAYAEYLTQGEGIKDGKLSFGYNHYMDRKQLAKMTMSIYEYNKDREAYKKKMQAQLQKENGVLAKLVEDMLAALSDDPGVLPNVKDGIINMTGGVFTGDLSKVDIRDSFSIVDYFMTYNGENTYKSKGSLKSITFNDPKGSDISRGINIIADKQGIILSTGNGLNEEDRELLKKIYKVMFPNEYIQVYNKHLTTMTLPFGTHDEIVHYKMDKKSAQFCVGTDSIMVGIENE